MTETLRSVNITHPRLANVTLRIGMFAPDALGKTAKEPDERRAVIEFHVRNQVGGTEVVGSLFLDQFEDFFGEAVMIGKRITPKSDG